MERRRAVGKLRGSGGSLSLIELLVVVVVLGILAGVVVFAIGGTSSAEQVQACRAERAEVQAAVRGHGPTTEGAPDLDDLLDDRDGAPALDERPDYWDVRGGRLYRVNVSDAVPDGAGGCSAGA